MTRHAMPALAFSLFLLCAGVYAQAPEWKNAISKDGEKSVRYRIAKRLDEKGESVPLIEYVAAGTRKTTLEKCVAIMKDAALHKVFQGDDVSELIGTISENEWILYYFTKGAGPFPDSDCVSRMTFTMDMSGKKATFSIIAAPERLEKRKTKRMTYYAMNYVFEDSGSGTVAITVSASMSPPFNVPDWALKMSFPQAAFDVLDKFAELAK